MAEQYSRVLPSDLEPQEALEAVEELAQEWGGEWDARGSLEGQLTLPVSAGLRRGWVRGMVTVEKTPDANTSRLVLRLDESHYFVDRAAVFLLSLSAAGGLFTMVWPFFGHGRPGLLALAPMAALLTLGGWFLVVSRLQQSGPDDFLGSITEGLQAAPGEPMGSR
ncbi:MAG: hypothetical protein K0U98_21205 [Deltaproteobacteria bacterium]|nr:hypothetical protein [Deltaproteobacteria bacterium]